MSFKKYIGDKKFYKYVLAISLPIMLQSMVTNLVSFLDNIMVGSLSTEAVSAVGIVNQIMFVFALLVFGALSGIGIFTVQYFGKGDEAGVRYTFAFKLAVSFAITAICVAVFCIFDEFLIARFINEGSSDGDLVLTLNLARQYMKISLWGMLPYSLAQCYGVTLRETGRTFPPMVISVAAVFINLIFNYFLIFGKLGFPYLGVEGAAIATVIARICECSAIMLYTHINGKKFTFTKGILSSFKIPKNLLVRIIKKSIPLFMNEALWSLGMTALARLYSERGIEAFAGYNIASTVVNLFNIGFISLGSTVGIIVGQSLGANKFDEAKDTARKLLAFVVFVAVITGVMIAVFSPLFPSLYSGVTDEAKNIATYMMLCMSFLAPVNAFMHSSYYTLRCGGKTFITFLFDSVSVWVLFVPVAAGLIYFTDFSIYLIYPIVISLEIFKCVIGYVLLKKEVWINNITVNTNE